MAADRMPGLMPTNNTRTGERTRSRRIPDRQSVFRVLLRASFVSSCLRGCIGPLYGALREFCSRCKRRIAVGAHGAPARSGAGLGAPASDEPGCGAEPHVSSWSAAGSKFPHPDRRMSAMNWLFKEEPTHYSYDDLVKD